MDQDKFNGSNYDDRELRAMLSEQVQEQMQENERGDGFVKARQEVAATRTRKGKKKRTGLKVFLGILLVFIVVIGFFVATKPGRKAIYTMAGNYIYDKLERNEEASSFMDQHNQGDTVGRKEAGIANYLLFGIEEINGARNTDSMMIATVNSKEGSIKITSLMRDSYVSVPGWKSTKLNAAYAKGGASLLIQTIEENFKIHIDGYAHVNFESFEKIVDTLGGVTIELGKKEAKYLNRTNYISNPEYRNVVAGENVLNGNQLLGYCRVRKVETLGGANNDYGRTVRHRRAMSAIFDQFKSLNILSMFSKANECMGYVTTSLTSDQIKQMIEVIIENKISSIETLRLPVDGMFDDPKSYQGTTYPLVYDWDKNISELYKFIYGEETAE